MRNLKKILALVLALVMSLSLMATASAADTTAESTASPYQTAVDVLKGVKVVKGDAGGDRLTDNITRAEVTALMYRIATGDVNDVQRDIHTGLSFTDVNIGDWYTGYISYCYIAEIIKGNPDGTFDPDLPINGYATLAMILRAMGYDKKGEFTGDGWEIRTASIAKQRGILEGITDAQLSGPATRALVFQILFQALLQETVLYNALREDYDLSGKTLGQLQFGLEDYSGVVMANQWANLDSTKVLAADTTRLQKADGSTVTINVASPLEAVGLNYKVYVANDPEGGSTKIGVGLEEDGNNVAFNEGERITVAKLASDNGLSFDADTEYYLNYQENWHDTATSKWQIRYAIAKASVPAGSTWGDYIIGMNNGSVPVAGHSVTERKIQVDWDIDNSGTIDKDDTIDCWVVSIRINATINATDLAIMYAIFDYADRTGDTDDKAAIVPDNTNAVGEVYAGTTSLEDKSDVMNWFDFEEEYLNYKDTTNYQDVERGNSLRIIDNDGNGVAEYVLKVTYTQDQAVGTYKDELEFNSINLAKYTDNNRYFDDEIVVGDVVNYTVIDEKLTVYKADMTTDTIHNKNFKDTTVTPTNETDPRKQSQIDVFTGMFEDIMVMDEKTEYNIYFDEFGHIRSYELTAGHEYALVTELYSTGTKAHNYIYTNTYTAEVKVGDAELDEYTLTNANSNPFISVYQNDLNAWTSRSGRYTLGADLNFLQPAIAHLGKVVPAGVTGTPKTNLENKNFAGATNPNNDYYIDWSRAVYAMITGGAPAEYGVFDYGPVAGKNYVDTTGSPAGSVDHSFSFTNVASYTMSDDGVALNTAARLSLDKKNSAQIYYGPDATLGTYGKKGTVEELAAWYADATKGNDARYDTVAEINAAIGTVFFPVYAVDYVQLRIEAVKAGMRHFYIDGGYATNYNTNSNGYVNTNDDTVFYVVEPDNVTFYDSYSKLPTIAAEQIRAAYAVATNTNADADGLDYWVGNVIVIETTGTINGWDSISLAYANPYETSGSTQYFDSLNNQWRDYETEDKADIGVVPNRYGWTNAEWQSYGFYFLSKSEFEDGELKADIAPLTSNFNTYGIYAGTIQRTVSIQGSGYIDVDTLGRAPIPGGINDSFVIPVDISYDYDVPFYRVSRWTADEIYFERTYAEGVKAGDEIIWVESKDGNVAYIVDLGSRTRAEMFGDDPYTAPAWLMDEVASTGLYYDILAEQTGNYTIVRLPVVLTAGQWIDFTYQGATTRCYSTDSYFEFALNNNRQSRVTVTMAWGGGATPGAIVPITPVTAPWSVTSATATSITFENSKAGDTELLSLGDLGADGAAVIALYSEEKIDAMVAEAAIAIGAEGGPATLADAQELLAELEAIQDDNQITTYKNAAGETVTAKYAEGGAGASTLDTNITTLETNVGTASDLADAKTAANTALKEYEAEKVAALTGDKATAAAEAKTTLEEAINDPEATAETINTAVAAYKETINGLIIEEEPEDPDAVTVDTTDTNVTASFKEAYKVGDYAAVINLECPAGAELPADSTGNAVQVRMIGNTALTASDWDYARDEQDSSKATITFTFGTALTGAVTVGITATAKALDNENLTVATVAADGEITAATGTATTGATVSYYLVPEAKLDAAATAVAKWNQLTASTAVSELEGTVATVADGLTYEATGGKLYTVVVKDSKIVAAKAGDAITVNETNITCTANGVTNDQSGAFEVTAETGTEVTFTVAADSTLWTEVKDSDGETTKNWKATFTFTLSGGFTASGEGVTPKDGGFEVVVETEDSTKAETTATVTVAFPAAD